ncbi:MAG: O-antigen ligase family protein [Candidatus Levyibacteriota bacterium]
MRHKLALYFDQLITLLLLIVAGFTPLLFLDKTTEFFEMPKLAFLVVATVLILGLWIFSWILKGKVVITRTPLDFPLLFLLGVVLVSTYFSPTRFPAIYGNFPRVHGSAISWVAYILLYFVTVSQLKTVAKIRTFLYVLYGSAVAVALVTIMSFFHAFLPMDYAKSVGFTPTGSSFSTAAFLLLLLPLPLLSLVKPYKYMPAPFALAMSILFGVTIVLIGSLPIYIALLIALGLCFIAAKPLEHKKTLPMFLIPVGAIILAFVLAFLPLPGNKLQQLEANFPKEIQLPFDISWKITISTFRDAPLIGTGPSSYLFNFTSYKPAEFNALPFWSFSFDSAYNEFLLVLGTLGSLGLLALVVICLITLNAARKNLMGSGEDHDHVLQAGVAITGLLTIVLLLIHATTLVSIVVTFFMLAVLMVSQRSVREKVMELSLGLKATTSGSQFDLFPVIVFIVFLIGAAPLFYNAFNVVSADYYHRLALSQASKNGTLTYQYLQKAEQMNPYVDLYRVDLAQTNFALANALAIQKGPTKDNPKGNLTDTDKKTIQQLLSQAINEGRVSVALSPRSSRDWEVLGAIYRNITGVAQNALAFSLDAYGRAIQRDPLNPALRVSVGGIYYSVKNYDLAIRFFTDAANLKPDYANAYFNLAVALRDKGDLPNAVAVAQQTVTLLAKDTSTPDYKVAFKLLADLKSAAAEAAKQQQANQTTAPAAQTNSALTNQNLNANVNIPNTPPQTTPAPAVKPNPNAKVPQVSTTPAPTVTPKQ